MPYIKKFEITTNEQLVESLKINMVMKGGKVLANISTCHDGVESYSLIAVDIKQLVAGLLSAAAETEFISAAETELSVLTTHGTSGLGEEPLVYNSGHYVLSETTYFGKEYAITTTVAGELTDDEIGEYHARHVELFNKSYYSRVEKMRAALLDRDHSECSTCSELFSLEEQDNGALTHIGTYEGGGVRLVCELCLPKEVTT